MGGRLVNEDLGLLEPRIAIRSNALPRKSWRAGWTGSFVLDVFQTGSGLDQQ